jgi:hypothetical protein
MSILAQETHLEKSDNTAQTRYTYILSTQGLTHCFVHKKAKTVDNPVGTVHNRHPLKDTVD